MVSGIPSQDGISYSPASIVLPLQQLILGKDRNWETGAGVFDGSEVGAGVSVGGTGVGVVVGALVGVTDDALLQAVRISMNARLSMIILFTISLLSIDKQNVLSL